MQNARDRRSLRQQLRPQVLYAHRLAFNGYEFYGQDSFKVKPNLTITYGLRWSLFSPPWETTGLQVAPLQPDRLLQGAGEQHG